MTEAEANEVRDAILCGWITTGPRTKKLEKVIADYVGVANISDAQKVPNCVCPLKCYDPFLENHKIAENHFSDFDEFLKELDMVVVMVKHDHIKQNWDKLKGKVVLDCYNICPLEGVHNI